MIRKSHGWATKFESSSLKTALREHGSYQYDQEATTSQFGHGTMRDLLGFNRISDAADHVLEGTPFENIDEECFSGVKEFITEMTAPPALKHLQQIDTEIRESDFIKGLSGWK